MQFRFFPNNKVANFCYIPPSLTTFFWDLFRLCVCVRVSLVIVGIEAAAPPVPTRYLLANGEDYRDMI